MKNIYVSDNANEYDAGDGKIGNYPIPTRNIVNPALALYFKLYNNRHFIFSYGLNYDEIMNKLKTYNGNVKYDYFNDAGTNKIYRITFI